jgi:DNA-binding NarL/FixJ family response regulator
MVSPKVIIADDHPLFRAALKQAISECFDITSILEAESFQQLLTLIEQHETIELLFLDLHMPGNEGLTGLSMLQNHYPDIVVIMVSSDDEPAIMQSAIDFGAAAFIPKSADFTTIRQAIDAVMNGEVWLPEHAAHVVPSNNTHQVLAKQLAQLTPQQYIVLTMVANGKLNKQIAYELNIKETTVKKHVSAILLKLGVNNRTLAGLAFQQLKLNVEEKVAS